MPHNLFRTTPGEAAAQAAAQAMFEKDVLLTRHLLFREDSSINTQDVPPEAIEMAELLLDKAGFLYDPTIVVLDLYKLDESKQQILELLQGV